VGTNNTHAGAFMKPIKTTLFITGAILFSMILASMKLQAQTVRLSPSQKVECEIKYYNENKTILANLKKELDANVAAGSIEDKIHDFETAQIKAEIFEGRMNHIMSDSDCELHLMDAEMELKGQNPSAGDIL
jgi:hypothetical protein